MRLATLPAAFNFTKVKPGGVLFNTAGSFTWICPEGVTEVSVALVGSGGNGYNTNNYSTSSTGEGGNLRYANKVKVVPGQTYTITIPKPINRLRGNTTALGLGSNDPLSATLQGANGGNQRPGTGSYGGDAGVNANSGLGFDLMTFKPFVGVSQNNDRNMYREGFPAGGGGGTVTWGNGGYRDYVGAPGAVRIIWGPEVKFPL